MTPPAAAWRPTAAPGVLQARARLLAAAREFFARRGVLEVDTPMLVISGVTEPQIQSIACTAAALPAGRGWLRTSPEYGMKRLLAAGAPDLYELGRVFRDGELGHRHQPEFTLAEWYRRGMDLAAMVSETCDFILALAAAAGQPPEPVTRHRYRDVFQAATGLDPMRASLDELQACAAARLHHQLDRRLAAALGGDRAAWLDLLTSHLVMPALEAPGLLVITHYPACQAALARLNPADADEAERFEVFRHGVELANGYRELTDAAEQAHRFAADRARRAALGLPDMPADEALLAALAAGLPDCCGVAVGFDRVLASYLGLAELGQAMAFGHGAG